jgi:hypothetical protein
MKASDDGDSPEELEHKIGRTRVDLGITIEALERQLAARQLVEKGLDMVNETLGGYDGVTRFVRDNPVPVALFGLGAAWLIAQNTGLVDRVVNDERVGAATRRAGELASNVAGRVGLGSSSEDSGRPLGHTGNAIVDQQSDNDSGWMHQVSGAAGGALRSARDSGGAVLSRAGDLAGGGYGRVADQITDTFERHPLVIGAVGLMAGALLAAVLPSTDVENEWMGETRDQLLEQAQEMGQDAVSTVRDTAVRAAQAAAGAAAGAAASAATGAALGGNGDGGSKSGDGKQSA